MADYYPLLSRAAEALEHNTPEQRRQVYERARTALVRQLRGITPPLSEPEITRERLALEDAIRRVEAEARAKEAPAPVQPYSPRPSEMPRAQRPQVAPAPMAPQAATPVAPMPTEAVEPPPEPVMHRDAALSRPPLGTPPLPQRNARPERPSRPPRRNNNRQVPMRVRFAPLAALSVIALLIAGGVGIYAVRDNIAGWFNSRDIDLSSEEQPVIKNEGRVTSEGQETPDGNNTAVLPVNPSAEIIEPAPLGQNPAVAQRAMLYEESPNNDNGIANPATVVWRTEQVPSSNAGQPQETQLRADIAIPERKLQVILLLKRNVDATLPASHMLEIQFVLPPDFDNKGIANVPGLLFKESEDSQGTPLIGHSVRVTSDFFFVGLSNKPEEQATNIDLLTNRPWMDLPVLYESGRRAVLTIEKGIPGEKAFKDAVAAWTAAAERSAEQ